MNALQSQVPILTSTGGPGISDLLEQIDGGKTMLRLPKDAAVFSQGDSADAIYFIATGKVKITVVSAGGKGAVLAVMGPDTFLGEGCLVGDNLRLSTATTMQPTTVFRIEKRAMLRALRQQTALSAKFRTALLARSLNLEEDLCNQLFNDSEKRLARVLLKLANFGPDETVFAAEMPTVSHELLAEMVGTTRSRVTHFMNKFRNRGLIDYNTESLKLKAGLLTDVVLYDKPEPREFDRAA